MKRKIETRLEWDFTRYGLSKGLATNLPATKADENKEPLSVRTASVQSSHGKFAMSGHLRVDFDRSYDDRADGGFSETSQRLMKLNSTLYREKVMSGAMGSGGSGFTMEFALPLPSSGFCEESIKRVLIILERLGVNKEEISAPQITQRTLVWVPQSHPLRNRHYSNWGWIEYGVYLGDLHGLSSKEMSTQ